MRDIHLEDSLKLSLLRFSKSEELKFVVKFEKIVGMLNKISEFEIKDVIQKKTCDFSDLRNDEVLPSLTIESIKNFSNVFVDGYFSSPKVLE
ncbi:Asp-tRNA(Asn)/Glu-tRNA(Gln) amidotransferase subunit GatC [Borrelia hermsii]|uniref:Glutamyl-tRNA(Gln) amidotransferase subunit C n=3 Tax=Borrelia hermsii TaxID=140 RepID=A0AAN1CF26_BORHE|nr:Asp-tRNA(Asn)/Glu-tRNA(Gln) amidotransferase subunit GatC [Borrelia hermsii]AAX16856.1 glutamyl-tRNA(Gln) amidotransferase subunit C [Borrelia hermsii DAH]AMR75493.1 Glutamyl-tRNA(Gln) amidotransferase subunit C [Borrelia hermsii]ANA43155.1 asparaginyl/glutamyl-tRNA amidotransferase subunit C [Borrelia hermsii HS1]UPA07670.1 Asp-tRNA(Asn)/Glu-tRNA(Gln) amidotransferase subunit GatC [Borrelia hermsii DAH]